MAARTAGKFVRLVRLSKTYEREGMAAVIKGIDVSTFALAIPTGDGPLSRLASPECRRRTG